MLGSNYCHVVPNQTRTQKHFQEVCHIYSIWEARLSVCPVGNQNLCFFFFKITTEWIFQHGWCPATEYAFITFKGCAAPLTSHLMLSFSSMSGTAQPEKNNSILCLFKVLNDPDDVSSSRGPETQGSECSLTLHYSNCKIQWFCNYGPEIVTYQSPLRRFWPLFFKDLSPVSPLTVWKCSAIGVALRFDHSLGNKSLKEGEKASGQTLGCTIYCSFSGIQF